MLIYNQMQAYCTFEAGSEKVFVCGKPVATSPPPKASMFFIAQVTRLPALHLSQGPFIA